MTTPPRPGRGDHPQDGHPEDGPREVLGDDLWDALGHLAEPDVPEGFDAAFRQRLHASPRRTWSWATAGAGLLAAAAAAALVIGPLPTPDDDLELVAELEIIENLDLLMDADVLMAWDGAPPAQDAP